MTEGPLARPKRPTSPRKRRMSVAVAVKYNRKLEARLTSLARKVVREQRSFDWMLKAYHEGVCAGPEWERAPGWVQQRARGWMWCFMHYVIPELHTEWCIWMDGEGHVPRGSSLHVDYAKVDADKGASRWKGTAKVWHGYDPTGEAYKVPDAETLARWARGFEIF